MARFAAGEFPLGELDARLKEAVQADGRDTLAQAYAAESEARSGGGRRRRASTVTVMGRVRFAYRYSDGRGADEALPELTGGEDSPLRATDAARSLIAETAARLDSVAEGCAFLAKTADVKVSETSALKAARRAGAETRKLWRGGHFRSAADRAVALLAQLEEDGRIAFLEDKGVVKRDGRRRRRHPEGSRHVGLTVAFSADGVGAPCTHADTAGIKGKNGEEAGTRESKLLTATFYDRVDKKGRPIVNEGCIVYYSSTKPSDEFISEVNALVNEMGYTRIQRVQFISDGAAWLEKLAKQVFADGKVLRVIDFYHACEYLGLVVRELSGDAAWKADFATLKAAGAVCLTDDGLTWSEPVNLGARAAIAEIERMFGAPSVADLDGDAAKALAYLRSRLQYMEYGTYREDGYYIGSGTVESACKSVVAARCKLAGMHWRLATVDAITILRATLRSRLPIAA